MFIFVVQNSGYDITYLKRLPIFDYLDLYNTLVKIASNKSK